MMERPVNMLAVMIVVLSIFCILLISYILIYQLQLRSINRQLIKRLTEHTRQPITLELISKELNALAVNINTCLKAEETLRLDGIREEKRFKQMIANISHDLRTPLTAIKGYQQLMEKTELSDEQKQKLKIAQKHTDDLGGLIEHFFEYSYLVNADPVLNIEKMNLTNLVTECLADSVALFEENHLTVHVEESPPVCVSADREMTIRIVQNMIRNCVAHSAGDVTVRIFGTEKAVISFKNPLKSTTDLDVERLFDRFYTGDKARSTSTGLGLSIIKLLAEQMDGNVYASLKNGLLDIQVMLPLFI